MRRLEGFDDVLLVVPFVAFLVSDFDSCLTVCLLELADLVDLEVFKLSPFFG